MYSKKYNIFKKILAMLEFPMYTTNCCGMIAVKREVAVSQQWRTGFPWSECQVRKLTTSHCTDLSLSSDRNDVREVNQFYLAVK